MVSETRFSLQKLASIIDPKHNTRIFKPCSLIQVIQNGSSLYLISEVSHYGETGRKSKVFLYGHRSGKRDQGKAIVAGIKPDIIDLLTKHYLLDSAIFPNDTESRLTSYMKFAKILDEILGDTMLDMWDGESM
ncbi:unnamed protein product [Rhizopus stolonifer]